MSIQNENACKNQHLHSKQREEAFLCLPLLCYSAAGEESPPF
jgi:hypothetical protein